MPPSLIVDFKKLELCDRAQIYIKIYLHAPGKILFLNFRIFNERNEVLKLKELVECVRIRQIGNIDEDI